MTTLNIALGQQVRLTCDEWEEALHPRGQPQNAGQFVAKGAGTHVTATAAPGVELHAPHHLHVELQENAPHEAPAAALLSWEAAPGLTSDRLPGFHNASFDQRQEYQRAIEKLLVAPDGGDVLAEGLGLDTKPSFEGIGVFQGRVNPGMQAQAATNLNDLSDDTKAKLNACECLRGLLLHQDAVAWHKPRFLPQHLKGPYLIPALRLAGTYAVAARSTDNGRGLTHKDALMAMEDEQRKAFVAAGMHENRNNFAYLNDKGEILNTRAARKYAEANGLLNHVGQQYTGISSDLISEQLKPEASNPGAQLKDDDADTMDFEVGRQLSPNEAVDLAKALHDEFEMDFYAPIATQKGFRLRNVPEATGINNFEFHRRVLNAIEGIESTTLPDNVNYRLAKSDGFYEENNWKDHPDGEAYTHWIDAAGPDVSERAAALYTRLAPQIEATEALFEKQYGWHGEGRRPAVLGNSQSSQAVKTTGTYDAENEAPFGAGVLYTDPEGNILFLKRSGKGDYGGYWAFPGGGIDVGETPEEAAARESHEEIGHRPNIMNFVRFADAGFITYGYNVDTPFIPHLNDEHSDWVWAPLHATPSPLHPGVINTLKQFTQGANQEHNYTLDSACSCGGTCTKCRDARPVFRAYEVLECSP